VQGGREGNGFFQGGAFAVGNDLVWGILETNPVRGTVCA
jgi:hypothetical protein